MSATAESSAYLEPLRAGKLSAPLFLVHAMGGSPRCYRPVCFYLADRSVYGFRAARPGDPDYPLTSIEAMAAVYARAVAALYPQGIIHLAGWSMGGLIAFEIARQLRRARRTVGIVGMIDTWMRREHLVRRRSPAHLRVLDMRRWRIFYNLVTGSIGALEDETHPFWRRDEAGRMAFVAEAARKLKPERYSGPDGNLRLFADHDAYMLLRRASDEYRPSFQTCGITFITAREEYDRESAKVWKELVAGTVEVVDCPGNHLTIVSEPNAASLAETLATSMTAHELRLRRTW